MKVFKNSKFIKRDFECINLVFCVSEKAPSENWQECNPIEVERANCVPLYKEGEVEYYGYL